MNCVQLTRGDVLHLPRATCASVECTRFLCAVTVEYLLLTIPECFISCFCQCHGIFSLIVFSNCLLFPYTKAFNSNSVSVACWHFYTFSFFYRCVFLRLYHLQLQLYITLPFYFLKVLTMLFFSQCSWNIFSKISYIHVHLMHPYF